jgi:glycosyltransferase involved in cell wall biosynthesis
VADRLKVAHVATIDLSLRFLLLDQLRHLQDAGYDVTGISSPGPHVDALHEAGIRHHSVPMTRSVTPVSDLTALWRLYRIMRRERFTLVHCHTPKAELLGQLAARLAGVPVVVDTFRGTYQNAGVGRFRRWLFIAMARLAASCADLVLCQSREAMDAAVRARIGRPDRIALLGNGICLRRFHRETLDPHALRIAQDELGLDPSRPVVGFVGRLVREKGLLDLFEAVRLVRKQRPDAQLLVVGPSDDEKPDALAPETAEAFGVASACVFTGMRTDMPTLYALMDVFALPSYRESFPRAPMEASAMGLPCVVTDIPGCREVVEHGRNGLLVPTGDASALAAAILELLSRPDLARQMGLAGRQKAAESFDEDRPFEILGAAYARLLSDKGITLPNASRPVSASADVVPGSVAHSTQS